MRKSQAAPRFGMKLTRQLRIATTALVVVPVAVTSAIAQIVPDGGTSTSVTILPSGRNVVSIAPSVSGISHNTYIDFSVSTAGAELDNRTSNPARTILNEVTSSRISTLGGPIEVLGTSAHIIVANPNGIMVDGVSFLNTGGVVLSTGKPSIVTGNVIAPGRTQDNVVLETSEGRIDVTGAGIGGAMSSLQLVADRIRIDGPVENESMESRSDLRLVAGGSRMEYDGLIVAGSDLENWGRLTEQPKENNAVAVEITTRGSLKANTVRIAATDKGAGVSHAGQGLASAGDFVIDAKGRISTAGSIKAKRNVKIRGASIKAHSPADSDQQEIEAANGALTLIATEGAIENTGVLMSGSVRDWADADSLGGVTLSAATNIIAHTEEADKLAIFFASKENLHATAGGSIINNTGRLLSNATTRLVAGGDVINSIDMVAGDTAIGEWQIEEKEGKRLWYALWLSRKRVQTASVDYGTPRIEDQKAYIVGAKIEIEAEGTVINRGGDINADDGTVTITAPTITNESTLAGSLVWQRSCGLTCVGWGESDIHTVGGGINASGDISLKASNSISNGGQITSYGNVYLSALNISMTGQQVAGVYKRPPGLYNFWRGSDVVVGYENLEGVLIAPQGSVRIDAFKPVIVNAGVIEARDGVIVPSGIEIVRPPSNVSPFSDHPIGLFHELVGE